VTTLLLTHLVREVDDDRRNGRQTSLTTAYNSHRDGTGLSFTIASIIYQYLKGVNKFYEFVCRS